MKPGKAFTRQPRIVNASGGAFPLVTVIVEIVPDGEIRFGPAPMKLGSDGSWQIPALTWEAESTVTVKDCAAEITLPNDEPQRIRLPNSFRGVVVNGGDTVNIEFENAKFYLDAKVH